MILVLRKLDQIRDREVKSVIGYENILKSHTRSMKTRSMMEPWGRLYITVQQMDDSETKKETKKKGP